MTSSNATAPITMMGSTSTLLLSDNDNSSIESTTNSTSMELSSTNPYTVLVSPSTSAINGSESSSSPSSTSPSYADSSTALSNYTLLSTTKRSSSSYHTHALDLSSYSSSSELSSSSYSNSSITDVPSSSYESSSSVSSSSLSSDSDSLSSSSDSGSQSSTPVSSSSLSSSSELISEVVYITTTSTYVSAVPYYPEDTSYPDSTTVVYTQAYCFTDDSTTLVTEVPVTSTVGSDATSFSSETTITTDIAFMANVIPGYKSSSSSASEDDNDTSSKTGTVAGSVVGAVGGACLILFFIWLWLKRRRNQSSRSIEKGFSHSIASTRRYDGSEFNNNQEKKIPTTNGFKFAFSSLFPSVLSRKDSSSSSSNHSFESTHSTGFGLGSLRSTILHNQPHQSSLISERTPIQTEPQSYTRQPPHRSTRPIPLPPLRTIDTLMEEPEASSSTSTSPIAYSKSKPQSYKTARYQNSGLRPIPNSENPFDDTFTSKRVPPPLPPARRANAYPVGGDYHRHGANRHSVTSLESSIVSDDTEDNSSDESLMLNPDGQRGVGNNTGFFKEIV